MGEGSEGITANGASEENGPGPRETHDVGSGPQEDRSFSAGEVGKGESAAEEGRVAS